MAKNKRANIKPALIAPPVPRTAEEQIIDIIAKAATSKNVDKEKMDSLIAMQNRMGAERRIAAYNRDMAACQAAIPPIPKTQKGSGAGKYAPYDEVDKIIRPIYSRFGFSVSFDTETVREGRKKYIIVVSHSEGHADTKDLELPDDNGDDMNELQGEGSTLSYAKRYLAGMAFNLVYVGQDNDGNKPSQFISAEQQAVINNGMNEAQLKKFLEYMNVQGVQNIQSKDWKKAETMIGKMTNTKAKK
jgi:hypothetical protein